MYRIELSPGMGHFYWMPSGPEVRIQELCRKAIETTDPSEFDPLFFELRGALHELIMRLRRSAPIKDKPHYEELCRQAAEETDIKKLTELVKEINRMLLEQREARLEKQSPTNADAA
jgi:hypothetical protein